MIIAPHPSWADSGLDYTFCYCDKIVPSRFGGQIVPIMESDGGRGLTQTGYKKLNNHTLDSIIIKLADQYGRPVHFDKNYSITYVFHIKPR